MRRIALPLALLCVASLGSVGTAQTLTHTIERIEMSRTPLDVALRQIFQDKASFIVSSEVAGEVTASFNRISADKALRAVLRTTKATFRFEDGIYYIEPEVNIQLPMSTPLTMDFKEAEVGSVIKSVMKACRAAYILPSDVTGRVTASLKGDVLTEALDKILEQVGATYSMEGGVINIRLKEAPEHSVAGNETLVSLDVTSADLASALEMMLMGKNISMVIDSEANGKVTAKFNSIRLEDALEKLLKQVNATYRTVGGVYEIIPISR